MSRTITTPITETGELELRGSTGLGSLMAIGALIHTARREQTDHIIQTDAKGLAILESDADTALGGVCDAVGALGRLLVYADTEEVGDAALTALGWLLVSLGEMSCQLQDARQQIEENIAREQGRGAA